MRQVVNAMRRRVALDLGAAFRKWFHYATSVRGQQRQSLTTLTRLARAHARVNMKTVRTSAYPRFLEHFC